MTTKSGPFLVTFCTTCNHYEAGMSSVKNTTRDNLTPVKGSDEEVYMFPKTVQTSRAGVMAAIKAAAQKEITQGMAAIYFDPHADKKISVIGAIRDYTHECASAKTVESQK